MKTKIEKLRERLERDWAYRQRAALEYVTGIQDGSHPDADVPWSERSTRAAVNIKVAETIGVEIRQKHAEPAAPRVFGVVAIPVRIESKAQWEALAQGVSERPKLIEAEVVPDGERKT